MSRIGKLPIPIPKGVEVKLTENKITVKGTKGTLSQSIHPAVIVKVDDGVITVKNRYENKFSRSLWGLTRSLINNMVEGVTKGFTKVLEINGVGYRADVQNRVLNLTIGFSHPVEFRLPDGIEASVDKQNRITISGIDKALVGQTAARIRALRPCDPYKAKGIKYADEQIRRKVGKSGVK
ncbi:MAG TPA: 50S ribosomal protein L6 [Deltaproteobacteria bacterium]|nr:MAG: 50S ribosomal protein L6 [Deltaproteobacteria bacterium]HDM76265.1 50S ribosomal protein L6 [Deltaproteobacteria bacterium]